MKSDPIDTNYKKLSEICGWYDSYRETISSESDARLKLIDRIVQEVLNWSPASINTEEPAGGGRLDYKLSIAGISRLIVEAKRTAIDFEIADHRAGQAFKLNGPAISKNLSIAIRQAIEYCAYKGAELACCTNGNQWIVFKANRLGDGKEVLEGKAFLFPSLSKIAEHFTLFYDLLSYESVDQYRYRGIFNEVEGLTVRSITFSKCVRTPNSKHLLPRDEFSIDFDNIMTAFFHRLRGEQDQEMIKSCFVSTKESEHAEKRLSRIADDLVGKMREIDTDTSKLLSDVIEQVQKTHKNRFVVLVGNKGCGKSTFVERFFSYVLDPAVKDGIVVVRLDLSLSSGDAGTIQNWLDQTLLASCEDEVYGHEGPTWDETVGAMFFKEYKRWSEVTQKTLYEKDRDLFKIKFGEFIENCRESDTNDYVRRLIANIAHSRKKIPCVVFDNTDHHSIEFQEAVFQYARSIYESVLSMMIMPMTDKTSWQLSRQGVLQSFENEIFHLPVPEPYRVIERRITYLSEKAKEAEEQKSAEYFLGRNIRLDVKSIQKFAYTLNDVFATSSGVSRWLGGLVNFDVRRLLDIIREVIGSPHLSLEELFSASVTGTANSIPRWKVKRAIIKQKYDIYPVGQHPYVQNIFELDANVTTSPLLPIRILQFLRDAGPKEQSNASSWVEIEKVYDYFLGMGFDPKDISKILGQMLNRALILNYDPTIFDLERVGKVEISPSGKTHLFWGTTDEDYLQHMAPVTNIRNEEVYENLRDCSKNLHHNWPNLISNFVKYLVVEDSEWCHPPTHNNFKGQHGIVKRLRRVISDLDQQNHSQGGHFTRFNRGYTETRSRFTNK